MNPLKKPRILKAQIYFQIFKEKMKDLDTSNRGSSIDAKSENKKED